MSASIILIDEHPSFRQKIARTLKPYPEFTIVGEADDAREGERIAVQQRPNIAVIDLSLPDISGIRLTDILLNQLPELKVVIGSRHGKIDYVVAALHAGALGYIVKDSMNKLLRDCLAAVLRDEHYLDPLLSRQIVGHLLNPTASPRSQIPYDQLSSRERDILALLGEGLTLKEIGVKLFISPKTVANHRANIMAKLNVRNASQLMRLAIQQGRLGFIKE